MRLIALVTAGFIRAVTEKQAPARRAAASTSEVKNALSARSSTSPVPSRPPARRSGGDQRVGDQPGSAARRVDRASPQPGRGDTGAAVGVLTVASSAFSPFTPE